MAVSQGIFIGGIYMFPDRLRSARIARGLTLQALADKWRLQ